MRILKKSSLQEQVSGALEQGESAAESSYRIWSKQPLEWQVRPT